MGGADEEWVKAALMDDTMVVELLVRLHRAPPPNPTVLPLEWSVRQRRSKLVSVINNLKRPAHSHRASPTTPLSWSGATSFSGGCDSKEYSRPIPFKLSTATRSKVNICGEKTISKRSRKKKTLAELKEEESSLLKERRQLKMEMTTLRMNLERQRATNEKLRMKIEFHPSPESTSVSISGQLQHESTTCHPITSLTPAEVALQPTMSNASDNENVDASSDYNFSIPDLNIPFDETIKDVPVHLFSTEAEHVLRMTPILNKG